MNKFFKNILLFALFTAVFYSAGLIVAGKFVPRKYKKNLHYSDNSGWLYTRLNDMKQTTENIDILILGSSRAYRGYDPRIFKKYGLSIFVLGSNGQTPVQTEVFAKRYLAKLKPKMIILDIYPVLLERDGVESALNIVTNDNLDAYAWRMAKEINHIKLYNSMIYVFLSQALHMKMPHTVSSDTSKFVYMKGGYVAAKMLKEKATADKEPRKIVFREAQMKAFDKLMKIVKDSKIPYYSIQSPLNEKLYSSFANEKEIDSFFASYGNYYNFNKLYPAYKTEAFYSDEDHPNQLGVDAFNNALIPMLLRDNKQILAAQGQ